MGNAYDIKDGSVGVGGELVLGGVSDKALLICEGDPRRSDTVTCRGNWLVGSVYEQLVVGLTLVVGDDFNLAVLHDTNARVRGSQIDTNNGAGDGIAVILCGFIVLGMCCLSQHQTADKDEEKVEGNGPCRAPARIP